jgi:hypothetical protein
MRILLKSVGNAADQNIPADPRRRRHSVEFSPSLAQHVRVEICQGADFAGEAKV